MIEELTKLLGQQIGNSREDYVKSITFENDGSQKISINGHSKEFTESEFAKIGTQSDLFKE